MRGEAQPVATSGPAKIALVLCGLLGGLAIVEVVLHLAMPSLHFNFTTMRLTDAVFTERAGRTVQDGSVRYTYDPTGFRIADGSRAEQAVLFIGDSFTEGFRVDAERSFPAQTCERLGERGVSVRCLNAGVTGFGTAHELRLMRRLLGRDDLHVAAIVFQVLPSNDFKDNWEDGGFGVEDGKLVAWDPPRVPLPVRLRVTLFENGFARASDIMKVVGNAWMQGNATGDPPSSDAAIELEQHLLEEVVATARAHRVPVVILVCAPAWEVDPVNTRAEARERLDAVTDALKKLHVAWLDSRTVVRTPEYYIPDDGHFSAEGNALIGEALATMLVPILSR